MPRRDTTLARIRLRHLQCFLAVAQQGNLRRAAQALAVTQPAVTKTLHELEAMLGVPLFVRGRKGAVLTPEAEVFLVHANASVDALGQAVDSVLGRPSEAPLHVGVLPTLAPSFMPQVLAAYAAQRPAARVRVHTGRNTQLIDMLRERELDVVLGRLSDPAAMVGVGFEHLYAEPLVAVLRDGHAAAPARGRHAPALAGLADVPIVLPLPGTMIRQVADAFLASRGIVPRAGIVETLDTALARALVRDADHLWLAPLGAVERDLASGEMRQLKLSITPEEPVGLMLRTDSLPSTSLAAFIGVVREQAARRRAASRPAATRARPRVHRR